MFVLNGEVRRSRRPLSSSQQAGPPARRPVRPHHASQMARLNVTLKPLLTQFKDENRIITFANILNQRVLKGI